MAEEIRNYRDLIVWQKACDLAETVYLKTRSFPKEESYGLTSQTRRAAVSVAANIAEGAGRFGATEYRHFVSVPRGSLAELRTLLELSFRFGYLREDVTQKLHSDVDEIDSMLCVLHRRLGQPRN